MDLHTLYIFFLALKDYCKVEKCFGGFKRVRQTTGESRAKKNALENRNFSDQTKIFKIQSNQSYKNRKKQQCFPQFCLKIF